MQVKYYDMPSDSLALFSMDIRRVGYFFCQLWFNFKPKKYMMQLQSLRHQQISLHEQGSIQNASASYTIGFLKDSECKLSDKEREYHLLTHKIIYLEGWVMTLIRVREMTLPDLNADFNITGMRQSYKTMNNKQYMCVGNEPRQPLDIRGISGIYWTIHPEFMYKFISTKIQDQRVVFSKNNPPFSSPVSCVDKDGNLQSLSPFSFQSIEDPFVKPLSDPRSSIRNQWMVYPGHYHHVFWASNMRKFTQGFEKCVWVFPDTDSLKKGSSMIFDFIKQTLQINSDCTTPVDQWSLKDVVMSSLYSKNEMLCVESRSMQQMITSPSSHSILIAEPFCDVFITSRKVSPPSSSSLSVLSALDLVAQERQSIFLVTLDALSYIPASIVRKTDHFFVTNVSYIQPVQTWISTYREIWFRNSKHIYVTGTS